MLDDIIGIFKINIISQIANITIVSGIKFDFFDFYQSNVYVYILYISFYGIGMYNYTTCDVLLL